MFEAVNNMALNMQGGGNVTPPQTVFPMQSTDKTADQTTSDNVYSIEQAKRAEKAQEEKQAQNDPEVTEAMLRDLEQDIESMHSVGLKFSKHNDTGRTMIKVMDKDNDQLIREIPAENVLDLAAKMNEMIGILFDKEV